jgi:hypothetical protein
MGSGYNNELKNNNLSMKMGLLPIQKFLRSVLNIDSLFCVVLTEIQTLIADYFSGIYSSDLNTRHHNTRDISFLDKLTFRYQKLVPCKNRTSDSKW